MSTEECYRILDLSSGANKQEIKRAYWKKAKLYHPDVNHSADAGNQFTLINTAYDLLTQEQQPAEPVIIVYRTHRKDPYRPETRQERMARHARMQYEEFKRNNEQFKNSVWYIPFMIFSYALWLAGAGVALGFMLTPLIMIIADNMLGFHMLPIILMGVAVMTGVFRFKSEINRYF